jgi:hypothetical protein
VPVLQQRQCRRGPANAFTKLSQREAASAPDMPKALAEHAEIKARFWQGSRFFIREILHFFIIAKESLKFMPLVPSGCGSRLGSLEPSPGDE